MNFSLHAQPLFSVRFRVVSSDGVAIPWKNVGVEIHSPERDALSYDENHGVNEDGSYTLGLIPPGHYVVKTYLQPEIEDNGDLKAPPNWQMAEKEVDINGNSEVVLTISRPK